MAARTCSLGQVVLLSKSALQILQPIHKTAKVNHVESSAAMRCRVAQLAEHSATVRGLFRQEHKQERFNWEKQWYPVAITADLDPSRPRAITLLGQRLVLWRAKDGAWQCFEDRCPHRLAPLSGTLACLPCTLFVMRHLTLIGEHRPYHLVLLLLCLAAQWGVRIGVHAWRGLSAPCLSAVSAATLAASPALPELLQYRMAVTSLVEHHTFCISMRRSAYVLRRITELGDKPSLRVVNAKHATLVQKACLFLSQPGVSGP